MKANTKYLDIIAVGGTSFDVRLISNYNPSRPVLGQDGKHLGSIEHGEIDDDGEYCGDDDDIIAAAREEYDIDESIPAGVR